MKTNNEEFSSINTYKAFTPIYKSSQHNQGCPSINTELTLFYLQIHFDANSIGTSKQKRYISLNEKTKEIFL